MTSLRNLGVTMVRPTMDDIPQHPLPGGFAMRHYQTGDGETWAAINDAADRLNDVTVAWFRTDYGHDEARLRERVYFLVAPDGRDVGTLSAWVDHDHLGPDWGRIHWVAILPEFQGRGLAKPMMTYAMNKLAAWHDRSFLTTSTARPVAIKIYLDFGFVPALLSGADRTRWAYMAQHLDHPLLKDERPWWRAP